MLAAVCALGTVLVVMSCGSSDIDETDEEGLDPAAAAARYELVILEAEADSTDTASSDVDAEHAPQLEVRKQLEVTKQQVATSAESVAVSPGAPSPVVYDAQGRFAVQVGSFAEPGGADRLVAELVADGYPAYRIPGPQAKGYRVRIGFFRTRMDAETFGAIFRADRQMEFWVDRRRHGE